MCTDRFGTGETQWKTLPGCGVHSFLGFAHKNNIKELPALFGKSPTTIKEVHMIQIITTLRVFALHNRYP